MAEKPEQWQPILTESFHPVRYPAQVAKEVLGEDVSTHRTFSKMIPNWRWPLWGSAFEGMTAKSGGLWKKVRIFGDDYHREGPPGLMLVPVALDKEQAIIGDGGAVIEHAVPNLEKKRFVISIFRSMRYVVVNAVATDKLKGSVEQFFKDMDAWIAENNFYRGAKIDANGKFLRLSDVEEADLILPEDIKRELFRNVKSMIEKAPEYAKYGIPGKRGIIMAGPPGNGKTMACKVLAKKLDCAFIWCSPDQVYDAGFDQIYEFARELAPSVVLLEDADVYGLDRRIGGFSPMLGSLLNILDGVVENKGVVTILSSNYAEVLDSALTQRPGRFDTKLRIDRPTEKEAFEIIRRTLERRQTVFNGDPGVFKGYAKALAEAGASGAFVVEVVNYAMMLAVERGRGKGSKLMVDPVDLQQSVERVKAMLQGNDLTEKAVRGENIFKWGAWDQQSMPQEERG